MEGKLHVEGEAKISGGGVRWDTGGGRGEENPDARARETRDALAIKL